MEHIRLYSAAVTLSDQLCRHFGALILFHICSGGVVPIPDRVAWPNDWTIALLHVLPPSWLPYSGYKIKWVLPCSFLQYFLYGPSFRAGVIEQKYCEDALFSTPSMEAYEYGMS